MPWEPHRGILDPLRAAMGGEQHSGPVFRHDTQRTSLEYTHPHQYPDCVACKNCSGSGWCYSCAHVRCRNSQKDDPIYWLTDYSSDLPEFCKAC